MKNKIHFSPASLNDLDEIWAYILVEFANPSAAQNVVFGILDSINKLEEFSHIGTPLSSITGLESNYPFIYFRKLYGVLPYRREACVY